MIKIVHKQSIIFLTAGLSYYQKKGNAIAEIIMNEILSNEKISEKRLSNTVKKGN